MNGMITEIERFALNDGPGIRTTVFLKGCNMHCAWCHNPETISRNRELHYYANKCIGCYKCVYACPCKAQKRINNEHRFFPNLCVKCGKCADICYAGAMAVSGTKMNVKDVMKEILQDKPYYTTSGGGVTLSGGEVLCQQEFARAITDACHENGIPVGIETNLSFPWEQIAPFIETLDLIMCDLKLDDSEAHKKWTGIGNEVIKENIRQLANTGKPFLVRTPLIPGATDSDENIAGIAAFLKEADVNHTMLYYELLNFNPLGDTKYKSLLRKNPFADARPLPKERVKDLQEIAASTGIPTRIE
ncbi:MAG: glycyl-radical enzyme activating protein [Otoolea sp.]